MISEFAMAWLLNGKQDEIEDAYKRGREDEMTDNLSFIKRYEQLKLQEIDELADKKLNELLAHVDVSKVVKLEKLSNGGGIVYVGGIKADEGKLANLKAEADFLEKSDIWAIIYESLKELAQRQMFVSSESLDDMKKGKSILYTLSVQKNILETFKSFQPKK